MAVYAVDRNGTAAEPLRLLKRRRFGNIAAESAITSIQWSWDSKLLLAASRSHVLHVFAPLIGNDRFSSYMLTDSAEVIGAYFKEDKDSYDVSSLFNLYNLFRSSS